MLENKTVNKLVNHKKVFSLEIFPPQNASFQNVYRTIEELKQVSPDFVSVTFGAGGSGLSPYTFEIASTIQNDYGIESVAHLASIHLTKERVLEILNNLEETNVKNVLALRGDYSEYTKEKRDFTYASDLIHFIKQHSDLNVLGACYPEGHYESHSLEKDVEYLKLKVDEGISHLVTQLFLDNQKFYKFLELTQKKSIHVPIEAGIMPVTSKKQLDKMISLSNATIPKKLENLLIRYEHDPVSLKAAGTEYAIEQIIDLGSQGVDGIHLYTMNNVEITKQIYRETSYIFQ